MANERVCLLDGGRADGNGGGSIADALERSFSMRGWSKITYRLGALDVAPCLGCFGCWVKTPGICIIDDVGREIARSAIQSDLVVLVTPIAFGGYSSTLKKAVDRLIPLILPYFRLIGGEVHHVKRYASYPRLLGVGQLSEPNQEQARIFRTVLERNAINMHAPKHVACVLDPSVANPLERIEDALTEVLS